MKTAPNDNCKYYDYEYNVTPSFDQTEPVIPFVDYLDLDADPPRLLAWACQSCGARFFDRRNACSSCGRDQFERAPVARTGVIRSYSIVYRTIPGVEVPFASALVELDDGKMVRGNLFGVEPQGLVVAPETRVEMDVSVIGHDPDGTQAVAFGFRTLDNGKDGA
jgi:uncharacterized OB-fold protein